MSHTRYRQLMIERPELFTNTKNDAPMSLILDEEEINSLEQTLGYPLGVIYEDDYILLVKDGVRYSNGEKNSYIRILSKHPQDGVVILPYYKGNFLLQAHFRHSLQKTVWEIPRGFGEIGSVEDNARRELFEETNISNATFYFLGKVCADSGLLSTSVSIFLAEIEELPSLKNNTFLECIQNHHFFSMEELRSMIATEEILDGFTLSAFSLAFLQGYGIR